MYLPPGTELNHRYVIESLLGHGGFGITYAAHDQTLKVRVAIKEYLPRQLATRGEGRTKVSVFTGEARQQYDYGLRKFLEEAQSVARFAHHPNVVSARDYFAANGTAYMVMEYVEGVTLKEYLEKKGGRISFEEAKGIMMPVMDALREVHQAGMLHRDISPDNIYITTSAQVKILDFGAARYFAGEQSKSLSVILKPGYAPEEQYRSKGQQGPWTDVYSTAATLYRALTGETPPEALDRMAEDTLTPPSRLGGIIPPLAEQALLKALAVNASQRFQTMGEFQEFLSDDGVPATAPERPITPASMNRPLPGIPKTPSALNPMARRPPKAITAGILGALGGIVLVAFVLIIVWKSTTKTTTIENKIVVKGQVQTYPQNPSKVKSPSVKESSSLTPEPLKTLKVDKQLTIHGLKNAEYNIYDNIVKLIEGKCNYIDKYNNNIPYELERFTFGDINNDGINDAAVIVNEIDGNAFNQYLCAVINENGNPLNVSCVDTGGNPSVVQSVIIKSGKIIIEVLTVGPHDSAANPTLKKTMIFSLIGGRLVEQKK
jgi:serine/threonine protein kinase